MNRYALACLALVSCATSATAATPGGGVAKRPVSTYSIVARDAETGELGVAVQSHWFSVGSIVSWAAPGVGAVATQSFVDPAYGPLGLELMASGKTAEQALASLVAGDEHRERAPGGDGGREGRHCGAHRGAGDRRGLRPQGRRVLGAGEPHAERDRVRCDACGLHDIRRRPRRAPDGGAGRRAGGGRGHPRQAVRRAARREGRSHAAGVGRARVRSAHRGPSRSARGTAPAAHAGPRLQLHERRRRAHDDRRMSRRR